MSWDERLFGKLLARLRQRRTGVIAARGAAVEPARRRLALLASAIAERPMAVLIANGDGGVRGANLVLPPLIAVLDTPAANADLLLARVIVGAMIARDPPTLPAEHDARQLVTLVALVRARAQIEAELPGAAALMTALLPRLRAPGPAARPVGKPADRAIAAAAQVALGAAVADAAAGAPELTPWLTAIAAGRLDVELGPARGGRCPALALCGWLAPPTIDDDAAVPDPGGARPSQGGRERAGRAHDRIKRRQLDDSTRGDNPLVHSFEKVHTLEKYQGGRKRIDGADELDAHGDALDELDLDEVVRSRTSTSSVYRADVLGMTEPGDASDAAPPAFEALTYDEWDERDRRYRRGWCQVHVEHAPLRATPTATTAFVALARRRFRRERAELAAQLGRLDLQPRWLGRQPDGPDIDVDSIVERHGALRHGTSGPEKLYVALRRQPPELAVALVLDRSLSSDAWVADQRVLDVGTSALVALGDALEHVASRTAVIGFASYTRRDCRLAILKDFDAPWAAAHARLAALEPSGYTRIGPALRHVTALLDRQPARRKLLVLLSDGKPTDYDRYEGRYGVADVHRAVDEADRQGVHVFAVALDQRARQHLPKMFGAGGFAVVTRPRDLVTAVGRLYQQRLAR